MGNTQNITNYSNEISENNFQNIIQTSNFSISGKILNIIERGGDFDEEDNEIQIIEKGIKRLIRGSIGKIENGKEISVFQKYFIDNKPNSINGDKIDSKFEKYFPIHLPLIIQKIKQKIDLLDRNMDGKTLYYKKKDIIKRIIRKYANIIFIIGEKIKLGELKKLLNIDSDEIADRYETVNHKIQEIDKLETEYIEKIKNESILLHDENSNNDLIEEKIFATAYRNIFKKITNKKGVSKEMEDLFKHSFEKLFIIFSKWIESNGKYGKEMIEIEKVLKKVVFGINIYKKLGIAFKNSIIGNYQNNIFLDELGKNFLIDINDGELKELYKKFIAGSLTNGGKEKFSELIDQINDFKKRVAESKIPESLKLQKNLDLNKVDFDGWKKVPEEQKYKLMFNQIIGKDGKIHVSDYLQLDNLDHDLVGIFTESYGIDYEIVTEQLMNINDCNNQTIEQFIINDINDLNLIIIWWRFLLKVRKLKNEGKSITIENIKEIKENPYGIIEKISEQLKEKKLLNSKKLNFKPEGKLNNISVETISKQLKSVIIGIKNGPINLLYTNIKQGNSQILIKNLNSLYIPETGLYKDDSQLQKLIEIQGPILKNELEELSKEISETKEKNELNNEIRKIIKEIENKKSSNKILIEILKISNWLDIGIDLCFNLLRNRKIIDQTQIQYLNELIKLKIIPENYQDINIKSYENIQDLVETLKYIKSLRINLLKMVLIGNIDNKKLENELEKLFIGEDLGEKLSGFGPQKSFIRAFGKLIKLYSGDFTKIGDLTRLRIVKNDINNLIKKVIDFIELANENENITHISIIDNIGEPISDAMKKSGYRDIKLLFTLKDGNVVELQFHFNEMLKLKEEGIDLFEGIDESDKYKHYPIFNKMKIEKKRLTDEDIIELFKFAKSKNIELPKIKILKKLMLNENIYSLIKSEEMSKEIFSIEKISATYLYDIRRQLDKDSPLYKKLTRFERVLSDNAWSKAVIEYLISMGIKIN